MAESEISASTRATCVRIHRETSAFYAQHKAACGLHGFETLYGPPIDKPDLMFVGYQPGGVGGANEIGNIDHAPWPSECLYRTATWHLARRLRETFGPLLERSTGLNAIFVRSPNIATYNREVSHAMRRIIADFCLPRAIEIIDATAPEQVVAIGFETLRAFGGPTPDVRLSGVKDRPLIIGSKIGDHDAIAILHLSGARISNEDRQRITDYVRPSARGER